MTREGTTIRICTSWISIQKEKCMTYIFNLEVDYLSFPRSYVLLDIFPVLDFTENLRSSSWNVEKTCG